MADAQVKLDTVIDVEVRMDAEDLAHSIAVSLHPHDLLKFILDLVTDAENPNLLRILIPRLIDMREEEKWN